MCLCESDPIETSGVRETRERCVCIACIVLHSNILQPAPFPSLRALATRLPARCGPRR